MKKCLVFLAVLSALMVNGCDNESTSGGNQTPVYADYDIGNLMQTAGSVTPVTITPKTGKSPGTVTIYYDYSTTLPTQAGSYDVTFDVAAAPGWNAASGLYAGWLNIDKAAGASVSTPTLKSKTNDIIIINPVTAPDNGQSVEYAISTGNTVPSTELWWQEDTTFYIGLNTGTNYYIYARSAGSDNYYTGTPSDSLLVEIPDDVSFNVTFTGPTRKIVSVTKIITDNFSKSSGGTITLGITESFTNYEWYVGGTKVGTSKTIILNADNPAFVSGNNWVTAVVYENAVPWSGEFAVVVTE